MADEREDRLSKAVEASLELSKKDQDEGSSTIDAPKGGPGPWAETSMAKTERPTYEAGAQNMTKEALRPEGPIGVDVGTSSIVVAEARDNKIHAINQTGFARSIPFANFTKNTPIEHEIPYFEMNNMDYLLGYAEDEISDMFHSHPWRPVPAEFVQGHDGMPLVEAILQNFVSRPKAPATPLYYSIPGKPLEGVSTLVYHEAVLKMYFARLGYTPMSINEGLAVIMSELAKNNFTGIGISMGATLCNVCLSYLSVPLLTYSMQLGGDYIDSMASTVTGEVTFSVKEIKENSFSLAEKSKSSVESALHIYYEDAINTILRSLQGMLRKVTLPMFGAGAVPVILSGGSVKPEGFQEMFEKSLKNTRLPIKISEVRLAENPITATAQGALVMAVAEEL